MHHKSPAHAYRHTQAEHAGLFLLLVQCTESSPYEPHDKSDQRGDNKVIAGDAPFLAAAPQSRHL